LSDDSFRLIFSVQAKSSMPPKTAAGDRDSDEALRKDPQQAGRAIDETAAFDPAAAQQTQSFSVGGGGAAPTHGGMGSVFLARDTQLEREVALKVPRLANDETGTLVQRFLREAKAAATLSHPNICPIYDVGEQSGIQFIAMGYIEGRPLTAYIESNKRQPERQVAMVVRKIALALEEAHRRGIVHRDLKPANIMIDRRGEPIVMDFGLACRVDDRSTRLTQDGILVGTPAYMSPEQIDQRTTVGPASDIYSLGVLLYELLTGACPFEGNVVSVIGQVLHAEPKPLTELRPEISPELADICRQAMEKDASKRFASMRDMAAALTDFLKQEGASGVLVAGGPLSGSDSTRQTVVAAKVTQLDELLDESLPAAPATLVAGPQISSLGGRRRKQSPPLLLAGAAVAAIVLLGIGLAIVLSGSSSTPPPVPVPELAEKIAPPKKPPARVDVPEIEPLPPIEPPSAPAEAAPPGLTEKDPAPTEPATETTQTPAPPAPNTAPSSQPEPAPSATPVSSPPTAEPAATEPGSQPGATPASPANPPAKAPGLGFPPGQEPPPPTELKKEELRKQFKQFDRNGDNKLDPT
jgi:serine/threonine-protein kinase